MRIYVYIHIYIINYYQHIYIHGIYTFIHKCIISLVRCVPSSTKAEQTFTVPGQDLLLCLAGHPRCPTESVIPSGTL